MRTELPSSCKKLVTGNVAHRKSPTTTSIIKRRNRNCRWKEQLRHVCLRRALQTRQQQQKRSSPEKSSPNSPELFQEKLGARKAAVADTSSPRFFLQEELRHRGVQVESPLHPRTIISDANIDDTDDNIVVDVDMTEAEENEGIFEKQESKEPVDTDVGDDEFPETMTEVEFIELLEEIESELNMALLEEEIEREEGLLQDQIAHYYEEQSDQHQQHGSVTCPLCWQASLESSSHHADDETGEIFCCSQQRIVHDGGTGSFFIGQLQGEPLCPFRLAGGVTSLTRLRERIGIAQSTHAEYCSPVSYGDRQSGSSLVFANPSLSTLTASCAYCNTHMRLYG
ncbi:hypothetical protein ACA910_001727 [Epithemia clementina (nom. ined.)]